MRDVILRLPAWLEDPDHNVGQATVTILYFITGNPGLISYYEEFLDLLAKGSARNCIVAGVSLAGFAVRSQDELSLNKIEHDLLWPETYKQKSIYDLRDQIDLNEQRLDQLVLNIKQVYKHLDNTSFHVILAGHSVGAYIALEVVKKHYERSRKQVMPFTISATMLLTPTIHDISKSPSGKIATPVLSNIPFFPALVQAGASSLTYTLPAAWLRLIVMGVTGMAGEALDTTVSFLQTPGAIKQALFMAKCEMLEIGSNEWTDDIWGVVDKQQTSNDVHMTGSWKAPKHYFLFAKEDHWVANITREAIVSNMQSRAKIVLDNDRKLGLVHAWCLNQSERVAHIVATWLDEVLFELKAI